MSDKEIDVLYPELRKKIKSKYLTYEDFANELGRTKQYVSQKLNGNVGFSVKDVKEWCQLLNIPIRQSPRYFF